MSDVSNNNRPIDPTAFSQIKIDKITDKQHGPNKVQLEGHNYKPVDSLRLNSEGKVEERAKWSVLGKLGNYVSTIFKKFEVLRDIKSTVNYLHSQVTDLSEKFKKDFFKQPVRQENQTVKEFNKEVKKYNENATKYNETLKNVKNQFSLFGRIIGFKGLLMKHRMDSVSTKLPTLTV